MLLNPFSQWETRIFIYAADADGNPTAELIWLGGTEKSVFDKMTHEASYAEERADIPGVAAPNWMQMEEQHAIELESVWLLRVDGAPGSFAFQLPRLSRNRRCVMVVIALDCESGMWIKRTFYSVTLGQIRTGADNQVFLQKLPFKAGSVFDLFGNAEAALPDEAAQTYGLCRYTGGGQITDLYYYEFGTRSFAATQDQSASIGALNFAGDESNFFTASIAGDIVLTSGRDGFVRFSWMSGTGGTYTDDPAALEFWANGARIASVSETGELAVARFNVSATEPDLPAAMRFANGADWLFSLDATGLYAPAVEDGLVVL